MPFNFQDTYVNPNVQIKGEEIPLEQLEKTSNVIQGRYDTSMDNETKIGAITKKLLASSNPIDHETAKQIMEHSKNRLAERAKSGNYQDMVWQTQQDAMDVAGMYEGLANRNKTISEYEKMIDLNPNNSPEIKEFQKNLYRKSIKNSTFNPENNVLEGLDVSAPNIVNSVEYGKWAMENAGQWKPDTFGGKNVKTINTKLGEKLPDGTISSGGLYKVIGNHVTEKVSRQEIMEGLNKMAGSNPALQASLNQDRQVYGDEITYKKFNDALNAAADAHAYTRQLANEDSYMFDPSSTNAYYKQLGKLNPFDPQELPTTIGSIKTTNTNNEQSKSLENLAKEGLSDDSKVLYSLDNVLNARKEAVKNIDKLGIPEEDKNFYKDALKVYNTTINDIRKISPKIALELNSENNNVLSPLILASNDKNLKDLLNKKGITSQKEQEELSKSLKKLNSFYREQGGSYLEDLTRKYLESNIGYKGSMNVPILGIPTTAEAKEYSTVKNFGNQFNINQFDIVGVEGNKNLNMDKVNPNFELIGPAQIPDKYGNWMLQARVKEEGSDNKERTVNMVPKEDVFNQILPQLESVYGNNLSRNYNINRDLKNLGYYEGKLVTIPNIGNVKIHQNSEGLYYMTDEKGEPYTIKGSTIVDEHPFNLISPYLK